MISKTCLGRKAALLATTALTFGLAGPAAQAQEAAAPPVQAAQNSSAQPSGAIPLGAVQVEAQSSPDADPYADPDAPYKADRLSSSKFTEPVLDTPRSVTVLTKEVLEDKNATSLREVARSTAGVTLGSGEGGNAFGDRFFIRGFDVRNDIFVDGVRDPGVAIRENYDTEQVEILRGPASSFAGRGTTGGAINVVTKAAADADFYKAEATGGLDDKTKRVTFDVNQTITPNLDVRINGLVQDAGVAGRDFTTDDRLGIAGAVTWRIADNVTVKANYSLTDLYGLPDYGVPYNPLARGPVTVGGVVPRDTYYGATNRDFTKSIQAMGTLNTQWVVDDWLTLENNARQEHSLLKYVGTIPENPSATGATAPYSSSITHFSGYTQLNAQSRYEPVTVLSDQPQATAAFDTGPVHNTAIIGGEFSSEHISIQGYTGLTSELTTGPVAFTSSGAPIVSVYDPPHTILTAATLALAGNPLRYNVNTNAVYLMDTANYDDFIIANAGIRYDDYKITATNNASAQHDNSGITSYNLGLVIKPAENGSIYAAYATGSEPVGDELDATSSAYGGLAATQPTTQIYGPQSSRAFELGVKWAFFGQHLLATGSVFQTNVFNVRETAPANLPGYTSGAIYAGAKYRVQGIDLELAGKITDAWSILGGLVIMDPKITQSIVPTNIGLDLANVAPRSFNLLTKYQLTKWLELGGQAVYDSQIKGGSLLAANGGVAYPAAPYPTILPSHWRFDSFAEARISDNFKLKLYGANIFNQTYYDSLYQSAVPFVKVAPGRAVSIIADVKF